MQTQKNYRSSIRSAVDFTSITYRHRHRGNASLTIPWGLGYGDGKPAKRLTGLIFNIHAMTYGSFDQRHLGHLYFSIVFQSREVDSRCVSGRVELHLIEDSR